MFGIFFEKGEKMDSDMGELTKTDYRNNGIGHTRVKKKS